MRCLDLAHEFTELCDPTSCPGGPVTVVERDVRVDALDEYTSLGDYLGDEGHCFVETDTEAAKAGVDLDMHGNWVGAGRFGGGRERGAIGDCRRQAMSKGP